MSRLQSLKPHHLLLGAIAAILIWLVGCGGQLPASLGGGTLGSTTDPGGGGAPAPSCAAAPAVLSPNANDSSTADSPHLARHGGGCPGGGSGSHHGHSTRRHGSHSHGHGHGHRRHHFDDDREHTSSSRRCDCDRAHVPASHGLASVCGHSAPTTAAA
jgi:hypothetical protein